ncbi:MAG: hypothetical protein QOI63_383 [Thermoplasmata archaeon]|jgi:hypothetical protein|nr:hypothetical protein [Thermoplasmata archaeon]
MSPEATDAPAPRDSRMADGAYLAVLMGGGAVLAFLLPRLALMFRVRFVLPSTPLLMLAVLAAYGLAATVAWSRRPRVPDQPGSPAMLVGLAIGGVATALLVAPLVNAELAVRFGLSRSFFFWPLAVVCLLVYGAWASWFAAHHRPAPRPPAVAASSEAAPWDDNGLVVALVLVGIVVAIVAFFFGALVGLGVCYNGCDDAREAIPLLMGAVPVGYVLACRAYLRSRRERAAADPAWAASNAHTGAKLAVVMLVVLLSFFALVATCFGLVGIGAGIRP